MNRPYIEATIGLSFQAHSKKLSSQIQSVVDQLETHIDPFDLDVFAPYIRDHLARQTQRANVSSAICNLNLHNQRIGCKTKSP